jgi:hypothetical protein
MPLCTFKLKFTGTKPDIVTQIQALEHSQDGIATLAYDNTVAASPITAQKIDNSTNINKATWASWRDNIKTERTRRKPSTATSFPLLDVVSTGTSITAAHFNELRNNLANAVARFTNTPLAGVLTRVDQAYNGANQNIDDPNGLALQPVVTRFTAPSAPTVAAAAAAKGSITLVDVRSIITAIESASAVCVCNCNYCTCNCNYCTCNCNYSCTCNCNYSDFRLKKNIIFSHKVNGINIYKFSYKWDDKKTYLGVMAQELLKTKYKNAVNKDQKGFYVVDYSKLPVDMREV